MASKQEKRKASSYLRRNRVPKEVVSADQLARASEETGRSLGDTLRLISDLLQAGSGLGAAPQTRRALERGAVR